MSGQYMWKTLNKGFNASDEFPNACHCGCGEPCPKRFVNQAHREWGISTVQSQNAQGRAKGGVDGKVFAKILGDAKAKNGWTWAQMAALTGRSKGNLSALYYGRSKTVEKATAEDILTRLSGRAMPATNRQTKVYVAAKHVASNEIRADNIRDMKLENRKERVNSVRERLGYRSD